MESRTEVAQLYNLGVNYTHLKLNADTSFIDISNIFDNHNKTVFIDWCHLGENGNEIVANKIGKTIQEDLRERE